MKNRLSESDVHRLMEEGRAVYGSMTCHMASRISDDRLPQGLAPEGIRFFLPSEDREIAEAPSGSVSVDTRGISGNVAVNDQISTICIITCNVDGLGEESSYGDVSSHSRIKKILRHLLGSISKPCEDPVVILFQEVTEDIFPVMKQFLSTRGWQVCVRSSRSHAYFVVTAVGPSLVKSQLAFVSSFDLAHSQQGRHAVTVTVGGWSITNVHAESNSMLQTPQESRDSRERQFDLLARRHLKNGRICHVVAGDLNMRQGEETPFLHERWIESTSVDLKRTYQNSGNRYMFDRVFYRAPDGIAVKRENMRKSKVYTNSSLIISRFV